MKNILVYVDPERKFTTREHEDLAKIQIDNSLSLGWKPEDIFLVTSFDYEHNGVKSMVIDAYETFDHNRSTKIPAINQLFRDGVIEEDEIYWFHDHDAFQLEPIEIKLKLDAGFTNHGYMAKWNAGSFFFKKSAKDIFLWIYEYMNLRNTNEQDALTYMWQGNINGINKRYKLMNITYNIGIYHIDDNVKNAELPIKVIHFHPHKRRHLDLFRDMLPNRLLEIFSNYGI